MANILATSTLDQMQILRIDDNPKLGAGVVANVGDVAFVDAAVGVEAFGMYIKTGTNNTDWTKMSGEADSIWSSIVFG